MNTELIKQEAEKVKLLKRSLMALRLELPKEVADSHEKITWDAMEEYAQSLQRPGGSDGSEAVGFAEWITGFENLSQARRFHNVSTTEQLYQLYKQQP
jgi:hypothetical protein